MGENRTSEPCDCFDTWDYFNVTYYGGDLTSDWNVSWCYVQGGTDCDEALDSLISGETRKWIECDMTDDMDDSTSEPCDCFDTWDYFNVTYYGCDVTSDWNVSWCYVHGGTDCDEALDSLIAGETRKWIECDMTDDTEDNGSNDGEDVTDDENNVTNNESNDGNDYTWDGAVSTTESDASTTSSTTAGATVSGSLQISTTTQGHSTMCAVARRARFGDTWNVLVGPLDCSDTTLLRGRRMQDDVSFDLGFDAMFSDTSSANSFSSEVTDAAESFQSEFVSEAASTLSINVTATLGDLTVTSADDTDSSSGITGCGASFGTFALVAATTFFN